MEAIKTKLARFVDDLAYIRELSIAQFMDPNNKDIIIYPLIWDDTNNTVLFM